MTRASSDYLLASNRKQEECGKITEEEEEDNAYLF